MNMQLNSRCAWPQHQTNGGTGLTKISPEHVALHEEALRLYANSAVWIEDDPCGMKALHSTRQDISDYWKIYHQLAAK